MAFEIGETVGDYQILGILGRGGMGAVYRVRKEGDEKGKEESYM